MVSRAEGVLQIMVSTLPLSKVLAGIVATLRVNVPLLRNTLVVDLPC